MSEFEKQRDLAAKESVTRYNNQDGWVQYEMRKCGVLSFAEGANWSRRFMLESDPVIAGLVEALKFYANRHEYSATARVDNNLWACVELDFFKPAEGALAAFEAERERVK